MVIALLTRPASADEQKQAVPNGEHDFSDKVIYVVTHGEDGKSGYGSVVLEKARAARLGDRYFIVGRIPRDINPVYKPYEGQSWWVATAEVANITEYDNVDAVKKSFAQTPSTQRAQAAAEPERLAPDLSRYYPNAPMARGPRKDATHRAAPRFASIAAFEVKSGNGVLEETEVSPYASSEPFEHKQNGRVEKLRIVRMDYRYFPRRTTFTLKNDGCEVFDAECQKLSMEQAAKMLAPGKTVLVSADGYPVAAEFLRTLKKEILVFVLPPPDPYAQGNPYAYPPTAPVVP